MKVFLILVFFSPVLLAEAIPDYSRSQWRHWVDSDFDCLNIRHELLVRESLPKYRMSIPGQRSYRCGDLNHRGRPTSLGSSQLG